MLRLLIRSGILALCILFSLTASARALPLSAESTDAALSLSAFWEHLVGPIVALWTGGSTICIPSGSGFMNGGGGATTNSSGTCDPNG